MKNLPEGYEIRTIDNEYSEGRFTKLAPFFRGKPIAEGEYPGIWGYWSTIRKMRRIIRLHRRYGIDRIEDAK